jgi:TetR/AcrR family tetracycline transcriptional repressor
VALTRDEVVRTAVRLLDEVGLDGLTLRRLAGELGVSAPTLYWHVRDKRALLDLMAEAIIGTRTSPLHPAPGQPWWEWLREAVWAQYRALVGHRDAALVTAGNRPTDAGLPVVERVVGNLVDVGFPPDEALRTILALGHYVIGAAVEFQAEAGRTAGGSDVPPRPPAADLPHLAAAARLGPGGDPDRVFGHGLDLMVAGLRARHAELVGQDRRP